VPPLFSHVGELAYPANEVRWILKLQIYGVVQTFCEMFRLAYTLLRLAQDGYRKNQVHIVKEHFECLQTQIGFELKAEDAWTAILHDNPVICETYIEEKHVHKFLELIRTTRMGK
jgi:hypothetical protein